MSSIFGNCFALLAGICNVRVMAFRIRTEMYEDLVRKGSVRYSVNDNDASC